MQKWKKLGQIFEIKNDNPFLVSHASNPSPLHLTGDLYRIFYSGRNIENKSSVGFVDINIETKKIINYPSEPLITFGNADSFCSHGISIGNIYTVNDSRYILFMGWQCPPNGHWRGDIGRLELLGTDTLRLNPEQPFMQSDKEDPVSLSYPCVLFHEGIYKMWYGSTMTWKTENGEMLHIIKYATSEDSIHWKKHGLAIPYQIGIAQAFSKPSVLIDSNGYHLWFSYRDGAGTPYRIGYAHSNDGIHWQRKEKDSGIDVSDTGWDSEMICYPSVFDHKGKRYMLYNGNGYGKTGFGLAVLDKN